MSDGKAILLNLVFMLSGVVLGAVPSWYFSRRYYLKSGSDLDTALRPLAGDAQKLLQATNTLGRMLEQAGIGKPSYDREGNLIGVAITVPVRAVAATAGVGTISVITTTGEPPRYDRQHEQPPSPQSEGDHA
jgi:hypothetical protein